MSDTDDAVNEIVAWLAASGYPMDYWTDPPLPERFRRPLAVYVHARDEPADSETTADDYEAMMAEEGRWLPD